MEVLIFSYAFALLLLALFVQEKIQRKKIQSGYQFFELVSKHESRDKNVECSQALFERLAELSIDFSLELFVHSASEEIHLLIGVPKKYVTKLKLLTQSIWHEKFVELKPFSERSLFLDTNQEISTYSIVQAKEPALPIKTAKKGDFGLFEALLRVSSDLYSFNEGIAVQVNVRPENIAKLEEINELLIKLNEGNYEEGRLLLNKDFVLTADSIKILESKVAKPLMQVSAKVVLTTQTKDRQEELKAKLEEALLQTNQGPSYNFLELKRIINQANFLESFYAHHLGKSTMQLNSEELTTLFHFASRQSHFMAKLKH